MKVASIFRAMSASFMLGKSVNFWALKTVPLALCWVTQLVTGQVRCQVTGRKPTENSARGAVAPFPTVEAGPSGMYRVGLWESFWLSR